MEYIDWEAAEQFEKSANEGKAIYLEPEWKFDCGFKLDFDGGIVVISSRFYPPVRQQAVARADRKWDGEIKVLILGELIHAEQIEEATLEQLRVKVEIFKKQYCEKIKKALKEFSEL